LKKLKKLKRVGLKLLDVHGEIPRGKGFGEEGEESGITRGENRR